MMHCTRQKMCEVLANHTQCVVCGMNCIDFGKTYTNHDNIINLVTKWIDPHGNWQNSDNSIGIHVKKEYPIICELDFIAISWNGLYYVYNGEKLYIHVKSSKEWVEMSGNAWYPPKPVAIWFEFDKSTSKWVVMPR